MLGLNDRLPLRDSALAHPASPSQSAPNGERASPAAGTARPGPAYDFHTDQWADLYSKRIDDMIAALKTKGVPVLWVGLPAIRGPRSTTDMSYLDELYRSRAAKAGIVYVDIWDGFVDDQGRYAQQGPDFEGQTRRLRTYDGIHFTKAGAVKLAHYVDHELSRVLSNRVTPVALPGPEESAKPGAAGQQPAIGPVLPLTAVARPEGGELLGGADPSASVTPDPMAASVLIRGEALAAPAGRADDFSWPHRATGATTTPVASTPPAAPAPAPAPGNDGKKADDGKVNAKPAAPAAVRRAPRAELDGAPRPPAAVRR
jgi:lysophospholipase L1-like esterase